MFHPASDLATSDQLHAELAALRTEIATQGTALARRIADCFQQQTRTLILTILGSVLILIIAEALRTAIG